MPGVQALAPDQPAASDLEIRVAEHHRRAFAAQFQGDGREVLGCSGHDQLPDALSASEKDVIKPLSEQGLGGVPIPLDHLDDLGRKGLPDQAADQLGRCRCVLRWFEDGGVPGR